MLGPSQLGHYHYYHHHYLLGRPLLGLVDARPIDLEADAAAAVLHRRLVQHAAVAAAEVPQHVLGRQARGAEDRRDPRRGARHEWRERARPGGRPLVLGPVLTEVEGPQEAALLLGVGVDDGVGHPRVVCDVPCRARGVGRGRRRVASENEGDGIRRADRV
eukprot:scaffold3405_cov57-Phaeocystis_antarctica.AAC.6